MSELSRQAASAGGAITIENNVEAAFDGAQVVYAKSWGSKELSMERPSKDIAERAQYREKWIVDEARDGAHQLRHFHALPARAA